MSDVWTGIAAEFLHLYPRGRRLLAVAGADAERSRLAAVGIERALAETGLTTERVHVTHGDEQTLRDEVVSPFRSADGGDAVLVVSGPSELIGEKTRRLWHFTVWQLSGDEVPHTAASAIVDVTDPQQPSRRFTDFCSVPASYGA